MYGLLLAEPPLRVVGYPSNEDEEDGSRRRGWKAEGRVFIKKVRMRK
jgi:hypothetical protein